MNIQKLPSAAMVVQRRTQDITLFEREWRASLVLVNYESLCENLYIADSYADGEAFIKTLALAAGASVYRVWDDVPPLGEPYIAHSILRFERETATVGHSTTHGAYLIMPTGSVTVTARVLFLATRLRVREGATLLIAAMGDEGGTGTVVGVVINPH